MLPLAESGQALLSKVLEITRTRPLNSLLLLMYKLGWKFLGKVLLFGDCVY